MKTTAIRMYGKGDLRMESFELPEITDDEILARIVSDSICMSSYKAATQGTDHKRIPDDVADKLDKIFRNEENGKTRKNCRNVR